MHHNTTFNSSYRNFYWIARTMGCVLLWIRFWEISSPIAYRTWRIPTHTPFDIHLN